MGNHDRTTNLTYSHSQTLALPIDASPAQIKEAYRSLAKIWHPDRYRDSPQKQQAEEKFKQINLAYEYLKVHGGKDSVNTATSDNVTTVRRIRKTPVEFFESAVAHTLNRRYTEAIADFNQAIKLNPEYTEAFAQRATVHARLGNEDKALHDRVRAELLTERAERAARKAKLDQEVTATRDYHTKDWTNVPRKPVSTAEPLPVTVPSQNAPPHATAPSSEIYLPTAIVENTWPLLHELTTAPNSIFAIGNRGKTLANGHPNGEISLWNLHNGKCFGQLNQHQAVITAIDFTRDDNLLISADDAGCIGIWHLPTASLLRVITQPSPVTALVITPEYEILSAGKNGRIYHWQIQTGKLQFSPVHGTMPITQLALSADGQSLVSTGLDQVVKLWDRPFHSSKLQFQGLQANTPEIISQFPEGWLTVNVMGAIEQWSNQGKRLKGIHSHSQSIRTIALHPDRQVLAIAIDRQVRIWHLNEGTMIADFPALSKSIAQLGFSRDGSKLIAIDTTGIMRIWQAS